MAKVFCLDQHNNYVETMSKEEILAAIQAAANGEEFKGFSNCAVVTQIKELNRNGSFSVWVGTQAEYNALAEKAKNVLYLIEDDPMSKDLPNKVEALTETVEVCDRVLQQKVKTLTEHTVKLETCEDLLKTQGETLTAHNEQLKSVPKVGYTSLFSGYLGNYDAINGVTISENYDDFDFLIFEFEEKDSNDSKDWRSRVMLPTLDLVGGITAYGLRFYFYGTNGSTDVRIDTENKKKLYFSDSIGAHMVLTKIYGYIRKGGA